MQWCRSTRSGASRAILLADPQPLGDVISLIGEFSDRTAAALDSRVQSTQLVPQIRAFWGYRRVVPEFSEQTVDHLDLRPAESVPFLLGVHRHQSGVVLVLEKEFEDGDFLSG